MSADTNEINETSESICTYCGKPISEGQDVIFVSVGYPAVAHATPLICHNTPHTPEVAAAYDKYFEAVKAMNLADILHLRASRLHIVYNPNSNYLETIPSGMITRRLKK